MASESEKTDIVVLGGGPGGYAAAFYAAARGREVTLIDAEASLGGTCLKRGCIPSKAYLHATRMIDEARESAAHGITFGEPKIDLRAMREWKDGVVAKLAGGIDSLAEQRGVKVVRGRGYFQDGGTLRVEDDGGQRYFTFNKAIIATGSRTLLPEMFDLGSERVLTSREALELEEIPEHLLVIGGGYIGLELGTVFARLGSKVTLAEAAEGLMPGADRDLVKMVHAAVEERFQAIHTGTEVKELSTSGHSLKALLARASGDDEEAFFDRALVAVGRRPNSDELGLENTAVERDGDGFIEIDAARLTAERSIYAIGDVVGGEMLAHKATREAVLAVDAICGDRPVTEPLLVPAVVFTEPEMAWVGESEEDARKHCDSVEVVRYDWRASGRALSMGKPSGLTKMVVDGKTARVLGVFIAGHGAGELIAEATLAIEMGATLRDLTEVIHAHPTLSETLKECAESFFGIAAHVAPKS